MGFLNPPLPPAMALRLFVDARRVTVSVDDGRARLAHDTVAVIVLRTGIDRNVWRPAPTARLSPAVVRVSFAVRAGAAGQGTVRAAVIRL